MTRVFYDSDADPAALENETVAILGYGIQGRAQALNLRDGGVSVVVGNRDDEYRERALADGFTVCSLSSAARQGSLIELLLPDEAQARVYHEDVTPGLEPDDGLVFAHGFALRYRHIEPPKPVDVLLLAPRMPGQYVRDRFVAGWGVPAFVSVEQDASGRAWPRLLALAHALGVTRCAAIEVSAAQETELDHFSEHFTYPLIFRALELAFESLVEAGYPPEVALMELHGSGEIGQVLEAAARQGLFEMIDSHASPACQVGIAHHWGKALEDGSPVGERIAEVLRAIRDGSFARHLVEEHTRGYPELRAWREQRSRALVEAERRLREMLRGPQ